MDSAHEGHEWIATQLAWEERLTALRVAYADQQGWDRYPAATWDQPVAA
jgi:hypothetical protein